MMDDRQLLDQYLGTHSESAFSELAARNADLAYSAVLRLWLRACAVAVVLAIGWPVAAPAETGELAIHDRIQAVSKKSGFRMDGYFVWCGSVLKVGRTYHMFASRWPVPTGFPDGYRQHSEIVRAVASRPEGPYHFQEVIISKRAAGK